MMNKKKKWRRRRFLFFSLYSSSSFMIKHISCKIALRKARKRNGTNEVDDMDEDRTVYAEWGYC